MKVISSHHKIRMNPALLLLSTVCAASQLLHPCIANNAWVPQTLFSFCTTRRTTQEACHHSSSSSKSRMSTMKPLSMKPLGSRSFAQKNRMEMQSTATNSGNAGTILLLNNNDDKQINIQQPREKQEVNGEHNTNNTSAAVPIDKRPHEQRVEKPRKARRLNHPFQHLYRHSDPCWDDNEWNDDDCDMRIDLDLQSILENSAIREEGKHSSTSTQLIDEQTALLAIKYLNIHGGYSAEEINQLQKDFPPMLELDVIRHLRPKMRFLKGCMGGRYIVEDDVSAGKKNGNDSEDGISARQVLHPKLKSILPANFFGSRLERTIAPRHAFLVHVGLPSGKLLWDDKHEQQNGSGGNKKVGSHGTLLEEFLVMHRKPKQFAALCNDWRNRYGTSTNSNLPITSEQIVAFDRVFQRGILAAARNDTGNSFPDDTKSNSHNKEKSTKNQHASKNNIGNISQPSLLLTANVTSGQLVRYLVKHGANPYETDVRGASLFHWAAGCGNLEGLKELVECCNQLEYEYAEKRHDMKESNNSFPRNPGFHAALLWKASRDHARPIHWAAAGAGPKEFGIGGHLSVCTYLLSLCRATPSLPQIISERKLINSQTLDGNSVLMWAAWSQSLDIVKLLIRSRSDAKNTANRNGCTVAHWAASGGNLSVCQYLHQMAGVDFTTENYAGNTPLSHAVAYGRVDVVRWLREDMGVEDNGGTAEGLATDFINWADMGLVSSSDHIERQKVYDLFMDWSKEMGASDLHDE